MLLGIEVLLACQCGACHVWFKVRKALAVCMYLHNGISIRIFMKLFMWHGISLELHGPWLWLDDHDADYIGHFLSGVAPLPILWASAMKNWHFLASRDGASELYQNF